MNIDSSAPPGCARAAVPAWRGQRPRHWRRGVAAVELAMVAPLLLTLLMGLWEIGRYVMVQDILDNAAREGGRLGASADYFSSDNQNNPDGSGATLTLPAPSTNTDYELENKVLIYLQGAGINTTGMTVTVTNLGTGTNPKNWSYKWSQGGSASGTGYDPTAAASQLDELTVTVTLPYQNVACSPLSWFVSQKANLTATTTWLSLTDTPVAVSATIPALPIGPSDPIP